MRVETADHVSAAMIIDDRRHAPGRFRPVEAQTDLAGRTGDHALLDLGNRERFGVARPRRGLHLLARLGRRHLLDRPKLCLGHHPQDLLYLRMKAWHYALRSPLSRPSFYHAIRRRGA
jgi:hypothetical protein